ncbi:MAG: DUF2244 domain-containing protein [Pseudomonadota bacterium]
MTAMAHASRSGCYLDLVLSPAQGLSRRGLALVMALVGGMSLVAGGFFLSIGAWPVSGFFGADLILLCLAFGASQRASMTREHITLDETRLQVARIRPRHRVEVHCFQPAWVRVQLGGGVDDGWALSLASHGRRLVIGAFLPPAERPRVAAVIRAALARRKAALLAG